jgi:hypothetical protein
MDSLLAIFAAPTAAMKLLEVAGDALATAARPFAEVLSAAAEHAGPRGDAAEDETDGLQDRVAERLQEIFAAAGAMPGECATVHFEGGAERIRVDHSPLGAEVEDAIDADDALWDDLRMMAELDDDGQLDLLVQLA